MTVKPSAKLTKPEKSRSPFNVRRLPAIAGSKSDFSSEAFTVLALLASAREKKMQNYSFHNILIVNDLHSECLLNEWMIGKLARGLLNCSMYKAANIKPLTNPKNMKKLNLSILAGISASAVLLACASANATTIFSDNFNTENGGVGQINYTGFANWTVPAGSVDLIGNGFYDFLPGHGLYVDLDGTIGNGGTPAGTLLSKSIALGAGSYELSFSLAGSQRGETKDTQISVLTGVVAPYTITLGSSSPFNTYTVDFTLASAQNVNLSFSDTDPADYYGALLDNVLLTTVSNSRVPDGGMTVGLLGMALVGMSVLRRKLAK